MDAFFMWKWAFSNLNQVCKTIAMIAKQYTGVFVRRVSIPHQNQGYLKPAVRMERITHSIIGLRCRNDHHLKSKCPR